MSKLFAAGCSHTEGFEITVPNTLSPQDLELRWSKCLADLLNKQEVNSSRGGADLDMVSDFALQQLPTLTSEDICVILWPEPSRLVAYLPKYDNEFGFYIGRINNYTDKGKIPGDVELFGDAYFELFNNNYNMKNVNSWCLSCDHRLFIASQIMKKTLIFTQNYFVEFFSIIFFNYRIPAFGCKFI